MSAYQKDSSQSKRKFKLERKYAPIPITKAETFPKRLLFFDTETFVQSHQDNTITFPFRLGHAIYIELDNDVTEKKRYSYDFFSPDEFIDIITQLQRSKQTLYIYAHNVGFDIRVLGLPDLFNNLSWSSEPPIINNRIFIWDVKTDKCKLTFLDTANYGVWSVESLGHDLGYPKLQVDFDNVTNDELIIYCRRDVEILAKFIVDFITFVISNELGAVKTTIASQAFTTYRTRFMHNKIWTHIDEETLQLEREGYFGGRVECFHIGKLTGDEYYYVDYNSMYPYVMANTEVPTKFMGYSRNVELSKLKLRTKKYYVIARVIIDTEHNDYPLRWKHKLIFPVGKFETVLHQPELELALSRNDIIKCIECAVYEKDIVFDAYIDFFYKLKEQYTIDKNMSWRSISKLFLNTLYGKFGQMQYERTETELPDSDFIWSIPIYYETTGKHGRRTVWYGRCFDEKQYGNALYASPAIAGAITAAAREQLRKGIELAGKDNVFYCDTDSYIVNRKGKRNLTPLLHDTELGKLAIEAQAGRVTIFNSKDYQFGYQVKHKGIPEKALLLKKNQWQLMMFEGWNSWLKKSGQGGAMAKMTTRSRRTNYDKGLVDVKTGKVTPIVFVQYD